VVAGSSQTSDAHFARLDFSPEGARYAGLPVERRLAWFMVMAGVIAALAAIILHGAPWSGESRRGTGYELAAITAVVLGGTSNFGGIVRARNASGMAGIAVLRAVGAYSALHRSANELTGVLTGLLLNPGVVGFGAPKSLAGFRIGQTPTRINQFPDT